MESKCSLRNGIACIEMDTPHYLIGFYSNGILKINHLTMKITEENALDVIEVMERLLSMKAKRSGQ